MSWRCLAYAIWWFYVGQAEAPNSRQDAVNREFGLEHVALDPRLLAGDLKRHVRCSLSHAKLHSSLVGGVLNVTRFEVVSRQ